MSNYIGTGSEWTFDLLQDFDRAIAEHAKRYELDTYPNQIEVITSEQMLDVYSSVGMPVNYSHWSFGKDFLQNHESYKKGQQGLAYEIVINSNPCIAYLMEENSLAMQALVIAHACYGHNSFFKGNYLFKQWTDADGIIDYLVFARNYVLECEERYGIDAVEKVLDACHALRNYGVDRYKRPSRLNSQKERAAQAQRLAEARELNRQHELYSLLPKEKAAVANKQYPSEPQENILYFIEKNSPTLAPWQRELVRIVRKVAQYFYPQRQTKVMNEGWATFWHYTLLQDLYDHKQVDDAFMLEWLKSHTGVVMQRNYNQRGYDGSFNPYALGFAMFRDIRRICENPTAEDRAWFPDIAGKSWVPVLQDAMRNYRDESFILQFLSPKVVRDFGLFNITSGEQANHWKVEAVSDDSGFERIRSALAESYRMEQYQPDIQVYQYNRETDRSLVLRHTPHFGRELDGPNTRKVMAHLRTLWGYPVKLETRNAKGILSVAAAA